MGVVELLLLLLLNLLLLVGVGVAALLLPSLSLCAERVTLDRRSAKKTSKLTQEYTNSQSVCVCHCMTA